MNIHFKFIATLSVLFVIGCSLAPKTKGTSNVQPDLNLELENIHVLLYRNSKIDKIIKHAKRTFEMELPTFGFENVSFHKPDAPQELQEVAKLAQMIQADAVLYITFESGSYLMGTLNQAEFVAILFDTSMKKRYWIGKIKMGIPSLFGSIISHEKIGQSLARTIMDRMTADQVLTPQH